MGTKSICNKCKEVIEEPKDEVMGDENYRDSDRLYWKIYCKKCAKELGLKDK